MRRARALFTLCAILAGPAALAGPYDVSVGEQYPDFVLPDMRDGTAVALSQFRGRKVLLIQFASW